MEPFVRKGLYQLKNELIRVSKIIIYHPFTTDCIVFRKYHKNELLDTNDSQNLLRDYYIPETVLNPSYELSKFLKQPLHHVFIMPLKYRHIKYLAQGYTVSTWQHQIGILLWLLFCLNY